MKESKEIYYFQRYSTAENWITNNSLLLLSRLYQFNRIKFETALNAILEESKVSINIGVKFYQQKKGQGSVPDGFISQSDFKVVIETKLYDNFTAKQLISHVNSFEKESGPKVLLTLSINPLSKELMEEVTNHLKKSNSDVKLATTSFETLINAVRDSLSDHEIEMQEIVDEYEDFCEENGLINKRDTTLLVLTCKYSLEENKKYNIYYDPESRNHRPFKFIGLYANKTVIAIGELQKVVRAKLSKGKLSTESGDNITTDEARRIQKIIEDTSYYDLTSGNKFYLVDKFYPTHFEKISWSSLRAKKYFELNEFPEYKKGMNASEIATILDGKTWGKKREE